MRRDTPVLEYPWYRQMTRWIELSFSCIWPSSTWIELQSHGLSNERGRLARVSAAACATIAGIQWSKVPALKVTVLAAREECFLHRGAGWTSGSFRNVFVGSPPFRLSAAFRVSVPSRWSIPRNCNATSCLKIDQIDENLPAPIRRSGFQVMPELRTFGERRKGLNVQLERDRLISDVFFVPRPTETIVARPRIDPDSRVVARELFLGIYTAPSTSPRINDSPSTACAACPAV